MRPEIMTRKGRRMAARLHEATATVIRPTGETVTDPESGVDIPGSTQVYAGACKVQAATPQAASPEAGGAQFSIERLQLHFPVASSLRSGDQATVTEAWDTDLVGLTFRLTELSRGSYRTADRWDVELVTRG